MKDVSLFRLYALRAVYLLIVVGLALVVWPGILHHSKPWELMEGVVVCMLAAFSLLCALGLRYPLQMLPVLLWELIWKVLWLSLVALPAWKSGNMSQAVLENTIACLVVIVVPLAMPWRYVFDHYLKKSGDRWRLAGN